ncbi:importin-13-like [Liolophura sinensis]|uniref:importin-13-like n=1 Tax=Liolophura sinensis TaxID=3198878 RepID=UPI0031585052
MEYSAENIESAVRQFYYDASLQREVHKWLTSAQVSPEAWSFSWELLGDNKSIEVQFFGASTLHVKIARYWKEVPHDQYLSLRTRLFERIFQFTTGPKMVLTRLCVAMSALALHTMPDVWPDPVYDMISTFQQEDIPNLSSVQKATVLLDLLTVVPEEFITLNLTHHRRGILRFELEKALKHVLPLLQSILTPSSPAGVYEQGLRCFASWVEFGIPIMEGEQIIHQVFQTIGNEQLFDTTIDTLVSVFSHPDTHRYPYTVKRLLPQVLQVQDMFNKAAQDSDMDTCHGICRLVVSVAENHSKMIVDSIYGEDETARTNCLNLINLALSITAAPGHYPVEEICSDLTFTFWYILQDDIVALEQDKYRTVLAVLQPIYLSLIEVLLVKVQHPQPSEFDSWSADEKEQFRCYRQDIGDTMMYAFNILHEPLLGHMCNMLGNLLESGTQGAQWQMIEAVFFLFGSVAESIDQCEEVYLPALLNMLPRIPFNNVKLISTALYMIGSFGEWLSYHPNCLGCVIPLLLQGMENPEVATAATMALKDVTRETLDHIHPYSHQILSSCKVALESNTLKSRENVRIMSSVGQVLSVMPFSDIMQYLNSILTVHLNQLEQYSKEVPSATSKAGILLKLNMLSWLFASLNTTRDQVEDEEGEQLQQTRQTSNDPKPVFVILQQICPLLHTIIEKWINDAGVIEAVCELFKRALRTLMEDFAPICNQVTQMLMEMYQTVPYAAILDISKQLIVLFSTEKEMENTTKGLFSAVCGKTLTLFQSGAGIQEHTDVVEQFMGFLAQMTKKCRHLVTKETCSLEGLFQAGIVGMALPESHTVKAACCFLGEFMMAGSSSPEIHEVTLSNAHHLIDQLLRCIGGSSPRGVMDHMADVLLSVCKAHTQHIHKWLEVMVDKEGYPSIRLQKEDKQKFIKNIMRNPVNKRRVREAVTEFTFLARGLMGTEYAAHSTPMI